MYVCIHRSIYKYVIHIYVGSAHFHLSSTLLYMYYVFIYWSRAHYSSTIRSLSLSVNLQNADTQNTCEIPHAFRSSISHVNTCGILQTNGERERDISHVFRCWTHMRNIAKVFRRMCSFVVFRNTIKDHMRQNTELGRHTTNTINTHNRTHENTALPPHLTAKALKGQCVFLKRKRKKTGDNAFYRCICTYLSNACMYERIRVCVCIKHVACMYVCTYVCMYVCSAYMHNTHTHTLTHTHKYLVINPYRFIHLKTYHSSFFCTSCCAEALLERTRDSCVKE
jgi:hypothetical protein